MGSPRTPPKPKPLSSKKLREAAVRLGDRLRAVREARGMTLESAAEAGDLNPVHIWKTEKAQLNVTLGTLVKLAVAYDVEVEELFGANRRAGRATRRR